MVKLNSGNDTALEKRIVKIMNTPNSYSYPAPLIYRSKWGYDRAHCPVANCDFDGFVRGFNQHFTRAHSPNNNRQKAQRIIKAVRDYS